MIEEIKTFREKYPQYGDMDDLTLANQLANKYPSYADLPSKVKAEGIKGKEKKGLFSQFKRIGEIYKEEVESSKGAMSEFYEKPTGRSALSAGLGAIQYVASPITALTKGAIGEPIKETTEAIGVPEKVNVPFFGEAYPSRMIGDLAENAAIMLPYGAMVKQAMGGATAVQKATQLERAGIEATKEAKKIYATRGTINKPPLKYPTSPTTELSQELQATGKLSKPVVQENLQKEVADAATDILSKSPPDEKKRIGQQIIDLVHSEQVNWKELPEILQKYNITPEEFAQRLKDTYSTAGRTLQKLSLVAKQVQKELSQNPEAQKFLDTFIKEMPEATAGVKVLNFFHQLESTRRGLLVTQLATAMRNAFSQVGRVSIGAIDEAFQGAIRGTVGGEGNTLKQIGEGLDTTIAFLNRFSPKARQRLINLLESENAIIAKAKLFSAPVHEIHIGGKITKVLNKLNTFQEHFFRKIAFEARLTQLLERQGLSIKDINPNKIPKGIFEDAAEYGLEMTFSAMPKSKIGQDIVRSWSKNPLATALVNPFPRFAFGNALPYLYNFSPISFLKALNPKVVAELATGSPEKFAEHSSKAVLGTIQLGMGLWLRNSEHRGGKWYEVKVGDKYYDTRSYAPLLSPYLLVAEAMSHPENLKVADWAGAVVGLNRVSGTVLVATDVIRAKGMESVTKTFANLTGAYLGSFSVPVRTFQDLYAGMEPEAAKMRDVKEERLLGPFKKNIPGVSETLPEAVSPLKSETPKTERPVFRQLTGISQKTKTAIEKEVDDLGIEYFSIYPKTGVPKADREISKTMGRIIEKIAPKIIEHENYKKLTPPMKRIVWDEIFSKARAEGRKELQKNNPSLYRQIKFKGYKTDIRTILESKGIVPE